MPLVAGFASSHAPGMFEPVDRWDQVYAGMPEYMKDSQPASAKAETVEVMRAYKAHIDQNFVTIAKAVEEARLDALIIVGDDQGDMFDMANNPAIAVFTGNELWGLTGTSYTPFEDRQRVNFKCDGELGSFLLKELMKLGFDLANCNTFIPRGHHKEFGVSHMVAHIVPTVLPGSAVPIVPIFLNEYFEPLPTGHRCAQLGRAIAEVLAKSSKRVGIYASGGLSHDPVGPRAGWIDEPLDEWILERLVRNDVDALANLFSFDSATLRGGTGEVRAWIVVSAAMNRGAVFTDYLPVHHHKAGLGFAYWASE